MANYTYPSPHPQHVQYSHAPGPYAQAAEVFNAQGAHPAVNGYHPTYSGAGAPQASGMGVSESTSPYGYTGQHVPIQQYGTQQRPSQPDWGQLQGSNFLPQNCASDPARQPIASSYGAPLDYSAHQTQAYSAQYSTQANLRSPYAPSNASSPNDNSGYGSHDAYTPSQAQYNQSQHPSYDQSQYPGYDQSLYASSGGSRSDVDLHYREASRSQPSRSPRRSSPERTKPEGNKGHTERFRVTVIPSEEAEPESVMVQVGMDGIQLLDEAEKLTRRVYPLETISRWALREPTVLTFWTKSPVDKEECTVRIMGTDTVTRSILDLLTCSCLQLCELHGADVPASSLQPRTEAQPRSRGNSFINFLAGRGRGDSAAAEGDASAEATQDDSASIMFWQDAEHEGWLMGQGEHIKTWRKRWFVLKQGYIFRFKDANVTADSKPRGVIKISSANSVHVIDDVKIAKPFSFELKVKDGPSQYFIASSEAEQLAWVREIENVIKLDSPQRGASRLITGRRTHEELAAQLEEGLSRMSLRRDETRSERPERPTDKGGYHLEPASPSSPGAPPTAPAANWQVAFDEQSGRPYFYNPATGVTQWEAPY